MKSADGDARDGVRDAWVRCWRGGEDPAPLAVRSAPATCTGKLQCVRGEKCEELATGEDG